MKDAINPQGQINMETETIESINQITDRQIIDAGYAHFENYETFFVAVMPMTYGKGRIIYALDLEVIENAWCYKRLLDALIAMLEWNPEKSPEPKGWFRNPVTGRRRVDGNPNQEYTLW